jgi:septal ring factor EnvC (AmiA/AmiB activator)
MREVRSIPGENKDLMTDQDLRDLVAALSVKQAEMVDLLRESKRETDRQIQETARQLQRTDEQLQRTDEQLQKTDEQLQRTSEEGQATARGLQETDRQLREIGRQLGKLGDKFGSFTEGMALPSMSKILIQRFGMQTVAPRVLARRNGRSIEIDVLAYSNSDRNEAYIVEVKSHLREDGIDQLSKTLRDFRDFFPEHANKKVFGILAAVDVSENIAKMAFRQGFYLARIHDDEFELQLPEGFQPRAY